MTQNSLPTLDWIVLIAFFGLILGLGFSAKLRNNSILQFLAAGRNLSLPAFIATLVCTWYGGILGMGESVAYFGIGSWLLLGIPYYIFAIIHAFYLAPKIRDAGEISIPERLETVFGKKVSLVSGGLIFLLGIPAAHILMLATLVTFLSGLSLVVSIAVVAVVSALLMIKGGLLADVRVSLLAFIAMYIGFAVIVGASWLHQGAPWTAWQNLDKPLLSFDGGQGPLMILSFFVLGAWTLADPGFHQRVASTNSPSTSRKGVLISVGFWMLFDILSISAGMYALTSGMQSPAAALEIFPAFGQHSLPPGLRGLFFCGMIGTILSALVGYSLVAGASLGREIICRIKPSDETKWSRIGIVFALLMASLLATQIQSVVALWYSWAGAIVGVLLVPTWIAYRRPKRQPAESWVLASILVGSLVAFGALIYGLASNNPYVTWQISGSLSVNVGTLLPGLIAVLIVLALAPKKDRI